MGFFDNFTPLGTLTGLGKKKKKLTPEEQAAKDAKKAAEKKAKDAKKFQKKYPFSAAVNANPLSAFPSDGQGFADWLNSFKVGGAKQSQLFSQGGVNLGAAFGKGTSPLINQGLGNLFGILQSGGKTDPALLNRQLTDISRAGEATQGSFDEAAARSGNTNTGLAQALSAAISQNTGAQRSGAIQEDNALAEARKRQDLQLLTELLIGPGIDLAAIGTNQFNAATARTDQKKAQNQAAAGAFLQALTNL